MPHNAVRCGNVQQVIYIVRNAYELRVDILAKDDSGYTVIDLLCPPHFYADQPIDSLDFTAQTLVNNKRQLIEFFQTVLPTLLQFATDAEKNKYALALLQLNDFERYIHRFRNHHKIKQIIELAQQSNYAAIIALANADPHPNWLLDHYDDNGITALYCACHAQDWHNAEQLINAGANFNGYLNYNEPYEIFLKLDYIDAAALTFLKRHCKPSTNEDKDFITIFSQKHSIDERYMPDVCDSMEYHKLHYLLSAAQTHFLAVTCNYDKTTPPVVPGSITLLQHAALQTQNIISAKYSDGLRRDYDHLAARQHSEDTFTAKMQQISAAIRNIVPWHTATKEQFSAAIFNNDTYEWHIFEVLVQVDTQPQPSRMYCAINGAILRIYFYNDNIIYQEVKIEDKQLVLDFFSARHGTIMRDASFYLLLKNRNIITHQFPCGNKSYTHATNNPFLLLFLAATHTAFFTDIALSHALILTDLHCKLALQKHAIYSKYPEKLQTSLVLLDDCPTPGDLINQTDIYYAKLCYIIQQLVDHDQSEPTEITIRYVDGHVNTLQFDELHKAQILRKAPIFELMHIIKLGLWRNTLAEHYDVFADDVNVELTALLYGIAPKIIAAYPTMRAKDILVLRCGVPAEIVESLTVDQLALFEVNHDPKIFTTSYVQALPENTAYQLDPYNPANFEPTIFKHGMCIHDNVLLNALQNVAVTRCNLDYKRISSLTLQQLFAILVFSSNQFAFSIDELDANANYSAALLLYLAQHSGFAFAQLATQAGLQQLAQAIYFNKDDNTELTWIDLACFIEQKTQQNLYTSIFYNIRSPLLDGLNEPQLWGLFLGFSVYDVCDTNFYLEKLAAVLFSGKLPSQVINLSLTELLNAIAPAPLFTQFLLEHAAFFNYQGDFKIIRRPDITQLLKPAQKVTPISAKHKITAAFAISATDRVAMSEDQKSAINAEFLRLCQNAQWQAALTLFKTFAIDLRDEYAPGKSPLEYITFTSHYDQHYVNILKAIAILYPPASNLAFYTTYKLYYPFWGTLACNNPLESIFAPHDNDHAAYVTLFTSLRRIQVAFALHNHFPASRWFDQRDNLLFKVTGSNGNFMRSLFLQYHRSFVARITDFSAMPDPICKVDLNKFTATIDRNLQNFITCDAAQWPRIARAIAAQESVSFEIECLYDYYGHNIYIFIEGSDFFIANNSESDSAIKQYTITDRQLVLDNLKDIFGTRILFSKYIAAIERMKLEPKAVTGIPQYRGFNCTYATMAILYRIYVNKYIMDELFGTSANVTLRPLITATSFTRFWSNVVINQGVHTLILKDELLRGDPTHHIAPAIACVTQTELPQLAHTYTHFKEYKQHLYSQLMGYRAVTKMLNIDSQDIPKISAYPKTFYELGPACIPYLDTLTEVQIAGLEFGLSVTAVQDPQFTIARAVPLLLFSAERVNRLEDYQLKAVTAGLDIKVVEQPWFQEMHANAYCEYHIQDPAQLRLLSLPLFETMRHDIGLISKYDLFNRPLYSKCHFKILCAEQHTIAPTTLLDLPGHLALGLHLGLTKTQICAANFNSNRALCVARGEWIEIVKLMTDEQAKWSASITSFGRLIRSELSDYKLTFLAFQEDIKFFDIDTTAAARGFGYRNGIAREIMLMPQLEWIHVVAAHLQLDHNFILKAPLDALYWKVFCKILDTDKPMPHYPFNFRHVQLILLTKMRAEDLRGLAVWQLQCLQAGLTLADINNGIVSAYHAEFFLKTGANIIAYRQTPAAALRAILQRSLKRTTELKATSTAQSDYDSTKRMRITIQL